MIICGLKLTHDASVALIEDDQLVFSIELEKLNNNERYTLMEDTTAISKILQDNGYKLDDVDHFAIDGWGGFNAESLALQTQFDERSYTLRVGNEGAPHQLAIADYEEPSLTHDVLEAWTREGLRIGEQSFPYSTYLHVVGHLMSAYCTSPFAAQGESSYILMWDGGTYPRLYYFDATTKQIANLGPLFLLIGDIYRIFARHFGPFEGAIGMEQEDLSIAGKVMAYIALGTVRQELFSTFNAVYDGVKPKGLARPFSREVKRRVADGNYPAADILRSLHAYLEKMLVSTLSQKVLEDDIKVRNICLTGGCALNIKWNSAIRSTGIFNQVYVPPFPNDSGNAIGAACAAMFQKTGNTALQWNVYNGPNIINNQPADGWQGQQCSIDALARILYEHDEPV
ncbi:MAG: hypothetical protein OEU26_02500, partial [Candidatus Tectomicrobia bacterium]|nr:hypothetical protein [Candidatus Tectomicrobia bacterium]